MVIVWERVLPVIVSILVIIAVAILREYSKTFAAIAATMPINIPLGMWIVYSSTGDNSAARVEFVQGLMYGILPTLLFLLVAWFAVRAGWQLAPTLAVGYIVWGVSLALLLVLRRMLGV